MALNRLDPRAELFRLAYRLAPRREVRAAPVDELDKTGRLVGEPVRLPVWRDERRQIIFPRYVQSIAQSYWRAQEFTLFNRARPGFEGPIVDFGCGDGSFSSVIFDHIDFGIDIDDEALAVAKSYGIYGALLKFSTLSERLAAGSIGTVFSCSVLEHTADLTECLAAIARMLRPGGRLVLTVPSRHFTAHMSALIDPAFAAATNAGMYHRNLLDADEWRGALAAQGFDVQEVRPFQPASFTRRYFYLSLFGNRGLGRVPLVRAAAFALNRASMMEDVARSLETAPADGANLYIDARRR